MTRQSIPGGVPVDPLADLGPGVACEGADGALFFMRDQEGTRVAAARMRPVARTYCAGCPVRKACKAIGGLPRFRYGLWGGVLYRGTKTSIDLLEAK